MKKILYLIITLFLFESTGMALGMKNTMDRVMSSWAGESLNRVISRWGYPTEEKTIVGKHLLFWNKGNTISENSQGNLIEQEICTRILEIDEYNVVRGWEWRGESCPSTYLEAKNWVNPANDEWAKEKALKKDQKALKQGL